MGRFLWVGSACFAALILCICTCSKKPNGPKPPPKEYITWTAVHREPCIQSVLDIVATPDGGAIVGGKAFGCEPGDPSAYVVWFDALGNFVRSRRYSEHGGYYPFALIWSMVGTSDGGCVIAGGSGWDYGDACFLRLSSIGDVIWETVYSSSLLSAEAYCVIGAADGSFIVTGSSWSDHWGGGGGGPFVLRLDAATGEIIQEVTLRYTPESGTMISSGRFVLNKSGYLVILDDSLRVIRDWWVPDIDGSGLDLNSVVPDGDGFVAAGTVIPAGWEWNQMCLVKFNSVGEVLWSETYGGGRTDCGQDVAVVSDGYVVVGYTKSFDLNSTKSDVYVVKTDEAGGLVCQNTYGWPDSDDLGEGVAVTPDGGCVIGARTFPGYYDGDFFVIKTDPNGCVTDSGAVVTDST